MPSNKDRLYVAIYARGNTRDEAERFHWALITGPKPEDQGSVGYRFHVRNPPGQSDSWVYEEREIRATNSMMLLGRICIGKITDIGRLQEVLRTVPVVQRNPGWNCLTWVQASVAALEGDGKCLGTRQTNWQLIERSARGFVEQKIKDHRYEAGGNFDMSVAPTYDLMQSKEIVG